MKFYQDNTSNATDVNTMNFLAYQWIDLSGKEFTEKDPLKSLNDWLSSKTFKYSCEGASDISYTKGLCLAFAPYYTQMVIFPKCPKYIGFIKIHTGRRW